MPEDHNSLDPAPTFKNREYRDEVNAIAASLFRRLEPDGDLPEARYFEAIATMVYKPLKAFISYGLGIRNYHDVDDILHETLYRFAKNKPDVIVMPVVSWLIKVAYHLKMDNFRRVRRASEMTLNEALYPIKPGNGFHENPALHDAVEAALGKLTNTTTRSVVHLCLVEKYYQWEVADILELTTTTINHHVREARKILKNELAAFAPRRSEHMSEVSR